MSKTPAKLPLIIQQEVKKAVGNSLQKYVSINIDDRQKLEQQGVNLSTILFEQLMPVIENTKVDSIIILMGEGIGNMVMLTPSLKALKHNHPRLKVTVWCKEPAAQVIRGWDVVDKVITEFDGEYYDLCFVSIWGHQIEQEHRDILQNHIRTALNAEVKTFHESIQQMAVAEFMGATNEIPASHCQIAEAEEATEVINIMLDVAKKGGYLKNNRYEHRKIIIFGDTALRHFGWDVKRWPHYQELAKMIDKKFKDKYQIFLIGDQEDLEEAKEKDWPNNVSLAMMGKLNIPQLAWLIKEANLYIGNDTGPTHIAAAVGTKTYAIFAPTMVSKNKPLGSDVTILNKRPPCSPCQYTDKFNTCDCLADHTANEVYNAVFFPENIKPKPKMILVGDFSGGALRNEVYIKRTLEKSFGQKVIPFDFRAHMKNTTPLTATYELLNNIVHYEPDYVLICGGHKIVPGVLSYISLLSPKTKVMNWYVDNRHRPEHWFVNLSSVCNTSFWSTGDPIMLSQVFSQTQKPCQFLPITPDDKTFKPMETEKTIDVLFVGTPHSKPRVELLKYLVKNEVKIRIHGDGDWPKELKSYVKPGIFDKDFVKVLNQAKIVLNINIINDVPLYFSDRYFQPMTVKTVGLNMYVPKLEEMFEDGKHMVFYKDKEDCLEKINELLKDDAKRKTVSEEGYKLFKEKYTLKHMLDQMFIGVEV